MTPNERIIRLRYILIDKYPGPIRDGLIELMADFHCSCYQRDIDPYEIFIMATNAIPCPVETDGLTPVDFERCQAEKPTEKYSFMTLGKPPRERCDNAPEYLVVECKPDENGKRGSMSLCKECLSVFRKQMGKNYAEITKLKKS